MPSYYLNSAVDLAIYHDPYGWDKKLIVERFNKNRYAVDPWAFHYLNRSMADTDLLHYLDSLTNVRDRLRSSLTPGVTVRVSVSTDRPGLRSISNLLDRHERGRIAPAKEDRRGLPAGRPIADITAVTLAGSQRMGAEYEIRQASLGMILDHAEQAVCVAELFYQHVFQKEPHEQ